MSWLGGGSRRGVSVEDVLAADRLRRAGVTGDVPVSGDQAMRLSVMWACRTLRADMVSSMPFDVYRMLDGVQFEAPKPPVFVAPGGEECLWDEWLYSSQMDLDGFGNTFGVIEERDGSPQQRPMVIRLVSASSATVRRDPDTGRLRYRLGRETYDQADVWHEKQYTIPGLPVGLSPIAQAAMTMNAGLSAMQFANGWFGNQAMPAAHLKNEDQVLNPVESAAVKARFRASMASGDVFVSGRDWSFNMLQGKASESMFLEQQSATDRDLCRFMGTPGDLVDVHAEGSAITYANITQRNLQYLILKLNPVLIRRENRFSYSLLPPPRYGKFNRGVLLQMDPATQAESIKTRIESRTLTVDEGRELYDLPPLTDEQIAAFQTLFPAKASTPTAPSAPGGTT